MVLRVDSAAVPARPPGIEIPGYRIASHPGLSPGQGRPWVARDFNPGRKSRVALDVMAQAVFRFFAAVVL
jgi:hypothetical protein